MAQKTLEDATDRNKRDLEKSDDRIYALRLYVAGATLASVRAIASLRSVCEGRLKGRYQIEVIDLFQQPELAREAHILAVPTLVKQLPPPLRRFVGDLAGLEGKLLGLAVLTTEGSEQAT